METEILGRPYGRVVCDTCGWRILAPKEILDTALARSTAHPCNKAKSDV